MHRKKYNIEQHMQSDFFKVQTTYKWITKKSMIKKTTDEQKQKQQRQTPMQHTMKRTNPGHKPQPRETHRPQEGKRRNNRSI